MMKPKGWDETATGPTDAAERRGLNKDHPEHHGRRMLAVEDRNSGSPFYGMQIWWCAL